MPRQVVPAEEIERVEQVMSEDPSNRFPVITRLVGPTYVRVLQECERTGHPISRTVEGLLQQHFESSDRYQLDDGTQAAFDTLCTLWRVSPQEAIRKMLEKYTLAILEQEEQSRQRLKDDLQKFKKSAR